MFRRNMLFAALSALILTACASAPDQTSRIADQPELPLSNRPVRLALSDSILFEIYPSVELLSGVQHHTSWMKTRGGSNRYSRQLKEFFSDYSDHAAVRQSQRLLDRGFSYDAPPAFALALDEDFRPPKAGYGDYLEGRARGAERLELFRGALAELAEESRFITFFNSHRSDYADWMNAAAADCDVPALSRWLREFYGFTEPAVFHYVFAPAMFPGGGYGSTRTVTENGIPVRHIYQVVRADGRGRATPGFPAGASLMHLGLHEFGHSFVNPAIAAHSVRLEDSELRKIYEEVRPRMEKMAYGRITSFYNELIIRAATVLGSVQLGLIEEHRATDLLRRERSLGFTPVFEVYRLLEEYDRNRSAYDSFEDYLPDLLAGIARASR